MKLFTQLSLLALLPLALLASPAHAQLTLNLTPAAQSGNPGDTFSFTGTLSNPTADTVFLNSDSVTFSGPASQPDDSPFLPNAPLSLDPMGTADSMGNPTDRYTGGFFNLTLDPNAAPGTYTGTFSVLGGADSSATNTVATEDFSVKVASPVPEASSMVSLGLMLTLGLSGLVWNTRRRKAASATALGK